MADSDARSTPFIGPTSDPVPAGATRTGPEAPAAGDQSRPEVPGYVLECEIGRGGMGVVHRARDLSLSRDLAVKVLQSKYSSGSYAAVRFLEEARITAQLQHPGIPPIHAVGTLADGRPFLAMKLIKGRTLDEILADPSVTRSLMIPAFEHICHAVAYAHNHGVIHRDLKPHNVMVGAFGEIQVMDWGLAKFRSQKRATSAETSGASTFYDPRDDSDENSKTRAGSFLGTPAYMSPEQALGAVDQVDERSDVFGLGAVLCAILTGRPPFLGETAESTRLLAAQGRLDAAFASLDACGAERELIELCKRCLAASPDARPANAGVVAQAVAEFRAAAEARARQAELDVVKAEGQRAAAALQATEQRKRRRIQFALALAFLFSIGSGSAFIWWRDREAARQSAEQAAAESRAGEAVEAAVTLSVSLRDKYRFSDAALALDQADAHLPPNATVWVRQRLVDARRELAFVRKLDAIRLSRIQSHFQKVVRNPGEAYGEAFKELGIDPMGPDSEAVGKAVAASPIKRQLLAAIDELSWFAVDPGVKRKMLAVARAADPGPWSDRLRDEAVREDSAAMDQLGEEINSETPANLIALYMQIRPSWPAASRVISASTLRWPNDFWLQFEAGFFYHAKAIDEPLAISHFRAAHAVRPDLPLVMEMMGESLGGIKAYDQAIACYREAIRLDPTFARAHTNLGYALSANGAEDDALAAHREAVRLDPGLAHAYGAIGYHLNQKGDFAGAIEAFRSAVALEPGNPAMQYNLGNELVQHGDRTEGIACLKEIVRRHPDHYVASMRLGDVLFGIGDFTGSFAAFTNVLRADASTILKAHANNQMGRLLAAGASDQRDGKRAIEFATRACELTDWGNPDCLDTLAAAHAESGDFEKAAEIEKRALRMKGNAPDAGAFRERLALYEQKKPFRIRTPAPPPRPVVR